jgi:hypothetical protein
MIWAIASDRRPFLPGVPTMHEKEIAERFGQDFTLERVQKGEGRWKANWYTLHRRQRQPDLAESVCVIGYTIQTATVHPMEHIRFSLQLVGSQ